MKTKPIQSEFAETQEKLHAALHQKVEYIKSEPLRRIRKPGEEFGLHLWVRRPGRRLGELELWASSNNLHREYWSIEKQTVSVQGGTGLAAVEAVYNGAPFVMESAPDPLARWQATIALPIELYQDPYRNILVGAITISSTNPMLKSSLGRLKDEAYQDLMETVQKLGEGLLTPGPLS